MKFEGSTILQFLELMEVDEAVESAADERRDVVYIFDLGDPGAMDDTLHHSHILLVMAIYLAVQIVFIEHLFLVGCDLQSLLNEVLLSFLYDVLVFFAVH